MEWIKTTNQSVEPEKGKTYWVTIIIVDRPYVDEAVYAGRGVWEMTGPDGRLHPCAIEGWWPSPKPEAMEVQKKKPFLEFPAFEVGKNGLNTKISAHTLSDEKMRALGFTDYREGYWYLCRRVAKDISFSITINKEDTKDFGIDVLDENFCQPYDYQMILSKSSYKEPPAMARTVYEKVEEYMSWLEEKGIVTGHVKGEYI